MHTQKAIQKNRYYDVKHLNFVICDEPKFFYGVFNDTDYQRKKRLKNIDKHIKNDDYFGTLSAILSLVQQNNKKSIKEVEKYNEALERFSNDLAYLQDNYKIVKK